MSWLTLRQHGVCHTLYILGSLCFVLLSTCTLLVSAQGPFTGLAVDDPYLDRQLQAMRPAFADDVVALRHIPRYRIVASFDPATATIEGHLQLRYTNTTGVLLNELVFRLYPNARTIYGGGKLIVSQVICRGRVVPAIVDAGSTVLRIPLYPPLWPSDSAEVNLDFTAQVPSRDDQGYRIFHHSTMVTSLAEWYPVLAVYNRGWDTPPVPGVGDGLFGSLGFYDVMFTLPRGYRVASTGVLLRTSETANAVTWHLVSGPARSFALALSDRFQREQAQVGDVTVSFYALLPQRPPALGEEASPTGQSAQVSDSARAALAIAQEALQIYERRFGPYPYAELDVVETLVTIKGYEFTGMVFMERALRTEGTWGLYRWTVAHEVAHQWWYGLVGSDPVRQPWLDESLATYSAVLYVEETRGSAAGQAQVRSLQATYGRPTRATSRILGSAPSFDGWLSYRGPVYYQGAMFYDALRREMGDARFFAFLSNYVARYRYRMATTADLLLLAREMAGVDLGSLYETWLGTSLPISGAAAGR